MKKRILASSMASVMALSSFATAAVAFAADDANGVKEFSGNTITKSELDSYVKSFEKFMLDGASQYGVTFGEQMSKAINYATIVAESGDDVAQEEVSAAYQMLKSLYDGRKTYDASELQKLVNQYRKDYNSNNILNKDLGDFIYKEDDSTWGDFVNEYEAAEGNIIYGTLQDTTDSYINLKAAHDALSAKATVSKADYLAQIQKYDNIVAKSQDYESWRRGTASKSMNKARSGFTDGSGLKVNILTKLDYLTFGQLIYIVRGTSLWDDVKDDSNFIAAKAKTDYSGATDGIHFLQVTDDGTTWGTTTVEAYVRLGYKKMNDAKDATKTSDPDIVEAYNTLKDAISIFEGWKVDTTLNISSKNTAKSQLINKYHDRMVTAYARAKVTTLATYIEGNFTCATSVDWSKGTFTANAPITLAVNRTSNQVEFNALGAYQSTVTGNRVSVTVTKGTNLLKYIPVDSADIKAYLLAAESAGDAATENAAAFTAAKTAAAALKTSLPDAKDALGELTALFTQNAVTIAVKDVDADTTTVGSEVKGYTLNATIAQTSISDATDFLDVDTISGLSVTWAVDVHTAAAESSYGAPTVTVGDMITAADYDTVGELLAAIKADTLTDKDGNTITLTETVATKYDTWASKVTALTATDDPATEAVDESGNIEKLINALATLKTNDVITNITDTTDVAADSTELVVTKAQLVALTINDKLTAYETALKALDIDETPAAAADTTVDKNLMAWLKVAEEYIRVKEDSSYTEADMEQYIADSPYGTTALTYGEVLDLLDTRDALKNITANGGSSEWVLLGRMLQYCFQDKFPEVKGVQHNRAELRKLIDDSYQSEKNAKGAWKFESEINDLVAMRAKAVRWLALANSTRGYKEGDTIAVYVDNGSLYSKTIDEAYSDLSGKKKNLDDAIAKYQYSYREISDTVGSVAAKLDSGKLTGTAIKDKMAEVANMLIKLDAKGDNTNEPFNESDEFLSYNRLNTNDSPNEAEKALKTSYEALLKLVDAQENPTKPDEPKEVSMDLNGDKAINALDVLAFVNVVYNGDGGKVETHDFNGDKSVNALDLLALVNKVLG